MFRNTAKTLHMQTVEPVPFSEPVKSIQLFDAVLAEIDHLRQLIMTPLPNVLLLGKTPYCGMFFKEYSIITTSFPSPGPKV